MQKKLVISILVFILSIGFGPGYATNKCTNEYIEDEYVLGLVEVSSGYRYMMTQCPIKDKWGYCQSSESKMEFIHDGIFRITFYLNVPGQTLLEKAEIFFSRHYIGDFYHCINKEIINIISSSDTELNLYICPAKIRLNPLGLSSVFLRICYSEKNEGTFFISYNYIGQGPDFLVHFVDTFIKYHKK